MRFLRWRVNVTITRPPRLFNLTLDTNEVRTIVVQAPARLSDEERALARENIRRSFPRSLFSTLSDDAVIEIREP